MEQSYEDVDIFLVVYDTLDEELLSIFVVVERKKKYCEKIIEQALRKMNVTQIHEMNFWYEGHIQNMPTFIESDDPYNGAVALKIEQLEQSFLVEEVLIFDVVFSNESDLVFHRKIVFPKNINLQMIEEEIRAMYWQVKDIYTISLVV